MPRRAPSPCRAPQCPNLVYERAAEGYCEGHQDIPRARRAKYSRATNANRRADKAQSALDAFYSTPAWRKLSKAHRAHEPLCRHCAKAGRITPAAVVDHIIERRDGGANYDPSNLQSLCHSCHNIKTQQERRRR